MTIIPIDGAKLRKIITGRGLTMTDVSRTTGYNPNYISECVHNGTISQAAAKIIETEHGIALNDYIRKDEPEPVKTEPEQMQMATWINYDALKDAIRDGVIEAWEHIKWKGME